MKRGETRACKVCSTPFYVYPNQINQPGHLFCSLACNYRDRTGKLGKRTGETRACKTCGGSFYIYPSSTKFRTAEYCSTKCRAPATSARQKGRIKSAEERAHHSASKKGVPNLKNRKPPAELTCLHCSTPFTLSGNRRYDAMVQKFCGRGCYFAHQRENPEMHGTYRGGSHPYYGPDWPEQARLARERDGYTCQDCGLHQRRPALQVHHLVPRRAFGNDYRAANAGDNLVTLCAACHTKRENVLTAELRAGNAKWGTWPPVAHTTYRRDQNAPCGDAHRWSLLTEANVRAIRQAQAEGTAHAPTLARLYGVKIGTIYAVLRRVTWKHVSL